MAWRLPQDTAAVEDKNQPRGKNNEGVAADTVKLRSATLRIKKNAARDLPIPIYLRSELRCPFSLFGPFATGRRVCVLALVLAERQRQEVGLAVIVAVMGFLIV